MKTRKRPVIGVFGHYGNKNLGDEAIIAAVVQNIKIREPDALIYGFSINPKDTEERHGVEAYPIRKLKKRIDLISRNEHTGVKSSRTMQMPNNLIKNKIKAYIKKTTSIYYIAKIPISAISYLNSMFREFVFLGKSFRNLKKLDKLFISGSNQFLDNFGGVSGFPYTLLKWTLMAKIAKVKVYYISLGAGPIKSKLSMAIVRACINISDYISFRDEGSRQLVSQNGNYDAKVLPDLAFSLKVPHSFSKISDLEKIRIGINPMPIYDPRYWPVKNAHKYEMYTQKIAELIVELRHRGYEPFLYNTQISDLSVIQDVKAILKIGENNGITIAESMSLEELIAVNGSADILIPTRFHGIILSYLAGKPVIGLCYGPKSKELITRMQNSCFAIDVDNLDVLRIIEKIDQITSAYINQVNTINRKVEIFRKDLSNQYDTIIKP